MPMHLLRRNSLRPFDLEARSLVLLGLLATVIVTWACSGDPEQRKQAFLESGNKYFEAGKYPEAIIEYMNAVQVDPKFAEARLRLVEAYEKTGNAPRAFGEILRAADLLPDDYDLQFRVGSYLLGAGRVEDARARAEAVLQRDPGNAKAHVLRGYALSGLKDFEGAVKDLEEAIRLDPEESASYATLGAIELARGERSEAEAALKKAVALSPDWSGGHLALANFYWETGNLPEAERSLKAALDAGPDDAFANRGMAAFAIAAGRPADAEPYLKRVAAASPAGALALADYYVTMARTDAAIAELQRLRKEPGMTAAAEERLVPALARSGARKEAYALADDMLKRDAKHSAAHMEKGRLLFEDHRREEALQHVRAAVEAKPDSAPAQFLLGKVYAANGDLAAAQTAFIHVLKLAPRATAAHAELAKLQIALKQPEAAIGTARQGLAVDPGHLQSRLALVRGLLARKDPAAAAELQTLVKAYPNESSVHVLQGVSRADRKDPVGARAAFQRALEIDPASIEAVGALNMLDASVGNFAAAKARVDEKLAAGETPEVLLLAGRTYLMAKDTTAAERFLRRAIELEPGFLPAYTMLGQMYVAERRPDEARREFMQLASRESRPVGALTLVGLLYQMEGNKTAAKEQYEKVVVLDPRAAIASNNLAWMYAESGENLDLALQLARSAVASAPDVPQISHTLGWILYLKGMPGAIQPLARAVELDADQPIFHYHLGLAYVRNGDAVRGRESLQRALAVKPDFPEAADARRALAELGR